MNLQPDHNHTEQDTLPTNIQISTENVHVK
jgi:hypothetical protein